MAKLLGTTIETRQGESFKLYGEITQEYRDGDTVLRDIPYILPTNVQNPYLILDVKSNDYPMRGTAGNRYWLDLSDRVKYDNIIVTDRIQLYTKLKFSNVLTTVTSSFNNPNYKEIYDNAYDTELGLYVKMYNTPNSVDTSARWIMNQYHGKINTYGDVNDINNLSYTTSVQGNLFWSTNTEAQEQYGYNPSIMFANKNSRPLKTRFTDTNYHDVYARYTIKNFTVDGTLIQQVGPLDLRKSKDITIAANSVVIVSISSKSDRPITYDYSNIHLDIIPLSIEGGISLHPERAGALYYINGRIYMLPTEQSPYKFGFKKTFYPFDTEDFINQKYSYSIRLATGQTTLEYLQGIFELLYPLEIVPDDLVTLKEKVCAIRKDLSDVDINVPLINYTTQEVILKPSKFIVKPII